jgi:3-phosphoshikimate 1-carboxyvinyltransferase
MELRVPGDKSITHRALILAALGEGTGRLRGALAAGDTRATASALRALGVDLDPLGSEEMRVQGIGRRGLRAPAAVLDCHNSGTSARLLLGVLAAQPLEATLTGDGSLRARPMRRVTEPLTRMGARIEELGAPDRLPLRVRGGELHPLVHTTRQPSAQVKSALLLAGLCAGTAVSVREPVRSRDHTERMLRSLGVPLREQELAEGYLITLDGSAPAWTVDLDVPGDFSSAAFLLAACALLRRHDVLVRDVGVNPTRTGLLDVLARMGAEVEFSAESSTAFEPRADLRVAAAELRATEVTPGEVPRLIDELPLVAVLAARAAGETVIRGAGELRVKESDRIGALVENLRALGGAAEELPDGLVVRGSDAPLRGHVRSRGDHRIAMAFAVLGAVPGNAITIDDPRLAAVSFPGFFDLLRRISEPA